MKPTTKKSKAETSTSNEEGRENESEEDEDQDMNDNESNPNDLSIEQLKIEPIEDKSIKTDLEAFKLSYSTVDQKPTANDSDSVVSKPNNPEAKSIFKPSPRRSSYIQFYKGLLYLYGGKFEDAEDKETTFNDMYCLNVKKMDEWKIIFEDKDLKLEEMKRAAQASGKRDRSLPDSFGLLNSFYSVILFV